MRSFAATHLDQDTATLLMATVLPLMPFAVHVRTRGRGPGSLEDDASAGLDYRVVTGDRDDLPGLVPLLDWYRSAEMVELVSTAIGESVVPSEHLRSGFNVNIVEGIGGRYELHTDAQPYTAILYLTDLSPATGGALEVRFPGGIAAFYPRVGDLLIFDGATLPHRVEPLRQSIRRVSVPLVYLAAAASRPRGLDDYLYG